MGNVKRNKSEHLVLMKFQFLSRVARPGCRVKAASAQSEGPGRIIVQVPQGHHFQALGERRFTYRRAARVEIFGPYRKEIYKLYSIQR